jgi:hypothetical protein
MHTLQIYQDKKLLKESAINRELFVNYQFTRFNQKGIYMYYLLDSEKTVISAFRSNTYYENE